MNWKKWNIRSLLRWLCTGLMGVVCLVTLIRLLPELLLGTGFALDRSGATGTNAAIADRFDTYISNSLSDALEGLVVIEKRYWLSDEDLVAPEPDPSCYGQSDDPASLQWLLDQAEDYLGVTDTLFSTQTQIKPNSVVTYYLDKTIFCVTWKQVIDGCVCTMSEVKIADASQFRRFLADGTYGSDKQYCTTEMAASVNAVVASAGDFYKYRGIGVIVHNRQVQRSTQHLDICYIDGNGDMLFSRVGQMKTVEEAQAFVDENDIRFSLAFGPVLVENGELVETSHYPVGEIWDNYSRAALAQFEPLHYLLVTANYDGYYYVPTIYTFSRWMLSFGVENAYALDGGQTATIVMHDQLINKTDYGAERKISDIIYFATAIPSE